MEENEVKTLDTLGANDTFEGFVIIKQAAVKTGQTGKSYFDLTVADAKGKINAKIWDYDAVRFAFVLPNALVKVRGTVAVWQGAMQLRIERIRAVTPEDGVDIGDYVKSAPLSGEEMYENVLAEANAIHDGELRLITVTILEEYRERLTYWPAAMANHHSIRSGLLLHVSTMLKAGLAVCAVYPFLNPDWIRAGVILHDMQKIEELDASPLGTVADYTRDGLLLGHVVQGAMHVQKVGERLGISAEKIALLAHMMLSHHYEPEYGAPRRPMFPEAEILHYLDVMDARMYDFQEALQDVTPGGFSERKFLLHNRRLYKRTCD